MASPTSIEVRKSVLSHVDGLTQWVFLLNGAAAAGLLTFLGGSLEKRALFPHWPAFSSAMLWFAIGSMFAVLTRVSTLLALNFLAQADDPSPSAGPEDLRIYLLVGNRAAYFSLAAVGFFLASSACFLAGVLCGRYALFG
jgi:hypothetical protein